MLVRMLLAGVPVSADAVAELADTVRTTGADKYGRPAAMRPVRLRGGLVTRLPRWCGAWRRRLRGNAR